MNLVSEGVLTPTETKSLAAGYLGPAAANAIQPALASSALRRVAAAEGRTRCLPSRPGRSVRTAPVRVVTAQTTVISVN